MALTAKQLQVLMEAVEQEDPVDFADLPFNDKELRDLIANHVCEVVASLDKYNEEDRLLTLSAVAAKLMLENFVLHLRLLYKNGAPIGLDTEALLRKIFHKK
jgi:hypothetical protein